MLNLQYQAFITKFNQKKAAAKLRIFLVKSQCCVKSPIKSGNFMLKTLADMDACIFLRLFFKTVNFLNHLR
jgi:hypothetical protein